MWPWAHAALGYLLYTLYLRLRGAGRPTGLPVVLLAVGTQLPDLVDKPLAWYVGVLPYGRTLMHSLVLGGVVVALLVFFLHRRGHTAEATALAIGYYSHLLGDAYGLALTGEWASLAFLVWPLLPLPGVESEVESVLGHLLDIEGSPFFLFGLALTALALGLWVRHGLPGLSTLRAWVPRGSTDRR